MGGLRSVCFGNITVVMFFTFTQLRTILWETEQCSCIPWRLLSQLPWILWNKGLKSILFFSLWPSGCLLLCFTDVFCPLHPFSSRKQFLTKRVVFIIYACDYLTVWSSFVLFCVRVLHLTLKSKAVFIQHTFILVLRMQFSTCFDWVLILQTSSTAHINYLCQLCWLDDMIWLCFMCVSNVYMDYFPTLFFCSLLHSTAAVLTDLWSLQSMLCL